MGTTVGNVLISYDINTSHSLVKTALENLGYRESFKNTNDPKTYLLPNTTMCHLAKSSDQAMNDLKVFCRNLQVTLQKAVAVKASEFVGI